MDNILDNIALVIRCKSCKVFHTIKMSHKQYDDLRIGKGYVQEILFDKTVSEKELLISGFCGPCFDKMFNEDEGGENE